MSNLGFCSSLHCMAFFLIYRKGSGTHSVVGPICGCVIQIHSLCKGKTEFVPLLSHPHSILRPNCLSDASYPAAPACPVLPGRRCHLRSLIQRALEPINTAAMMGATHCKACSRA